MQCSFVKRFAAKGIVPLTAMWDKQFVIKLSFVPLSTFIYISIEHLYLWNWPMHTFVWLSRHTALWQYNIIMFIYININIIEFINTITKSNGLVVFRLINHFQGNGRVQTSDYNHGCVGRAIIQTDKTLLVRKTSPCMRNHLMVVLFRFLYVGNSLLLEVDGFVCWCIKPIQNNTALNLSKK